MNQSYNKFKKILKVLSLFQSNKAIPEKCLSFEKEWDWN